MDFIGHYNQFVAIALMMVGLWITIESNNLVKKLIGLNVFQASVFVLFISIGKVEGGSAPVLADGIEVYSNPLPQVLILTAIVVGVATTSLGLALIVRIRAAYGTVEEDRIDAIETQP